MSLFVLCGIALILSLGLPGMSGPSGSSFSSGSTAVAKVGNQEVSIMELQEDIARREEQFRKIFGAQANTEQGKQIFNQIRKNNLNPDNILDGLLQRKILFHLFDEQGLEISQAAVRSEIEKSPYFQKNGVFDAALYKEKVNFPAKFEDYMRNQLKGERVMEPFAFVGSLLSEAEIEFERKLAKKREFEILTIPSSAYKKDVQVSEGEAAALAGDEKKTAELQAFYNKNIQNYKKSEEVSARHILIKVDEKTDDKAAQAKINEVETLINSKKITFQEAAKKFSQDMSNAPKGGDLGFFTRGMMDKAFEEAAYSLKNSGDISKAVKSSFGYHLIQLVDRKAAIDKNFADVKNEIAKLYLITQKKTDALKSTADSWVKSAKGPDAAQMKAFGVQWTKVPAWDPGQQKIPALAETDVNTTELLSLNKEAPLLKRVLSSANSLVLLRFVGEKETAVQVEELALQKSSRIMDLYFEKYKKSLEQNKKIVKSEKLIAQLKAAMDLK